MQDKSIVYFSCLFLSILAIVGGIFIALGRLDKLECHRELGKCILKNHNDKNIIAFNISEINNNLRIDMQRNDHWRNKFSCFDSFLQLGLNGQEITLFKNSDCYDYEFHPSLIITQDIPDFIYDQKPYRDLERKKIELINFSTSTENELVLKSQKGEGFITGWIVSFLGLIILLLLLFKKKFFYTYFDKLSNTISQDH